MTYVESLPSLSAQLYLNKYIHGIKTRTPGHCKSAQFPIWWSFGAEKPLGLQPLGFSALKAHLIGNCVNSQWPGVLAITFHMGLYRQAPLVRQLTFTEHTIEVSSCWHMCGQGYLAPKPMQDTCTRAFPHVHLYMWQVTAQQECTRPSLSHTHKDTRTHTHNAVINYSQFAVSSACVFCW